MALSTAIEVAGAIVDLYPNGGQSAGDGYIGGLAKILGNYPRSVATRAADPINGVARDTKFLPTPSDLVAWCERETAPMHEDYVKARKASERPPEDNTDPAVTDRMRELAMAWKTRADPKAQKLTGSSLEVEKVRDERRKESNREAFERSRAETLAEYDRAGLKSLSIGRIPISVELARMLGKEPTNYRDEDLTRSA